MKKKTCPLIPAGFILVILALCPTRSPAATIFSQTGPADGFLTEASNEFWAQSFTLSASPMTLNSVDVLLAGGGGAPNQFFMDLYSDNSGTPGSLLEALSGPSTPGGGSPGTYNYTSGGWLLSANTTYWIVQGISSGSGFEYWNQENNNSPEVGSSVGLYFSVNSGAS